MAQQHDFHFVKLKKKNLLKINEAQEYYEKKLQIKSKKHFNKKSA